MPPALRIENKGTEVSVGGNFGGDVKILKRQRDLTFALRLL